MVKPGAMFPGLAACFSKRTDALTIFCVISKSSSSVFWRRQWTRTAEVMVLHPAKAAIRYRDHRWQQNSRVTSLPSISTEVFCPNLNFSRQPEVAENTRDQDFPGGPVVKNPPASAGDPGSSLVWEDSICCRQLKPRTTAEAPAPQTPCSVTREPTTVRSLCATTRESLHTAINTQHSQK